jgi:predicted dehydrogenase
MTRCWRTGILGSGDIAPRYAQSLAQAGNIDLVAAASRSPGSAQRCAAMFGGQAVNLDELLDGDLIDALVILTPPQQHEEAIAGATERGLAVYCEKPFALTPEAANALANRAAGHEIMLAAAPAVHLGPSLTRARSLVDEGTIGEVVGGAATLVYPGPDKWHHNPDHLFTSGGGPLWDMGVYHLSALVFLLGPVAAVQATGSQSRSTRVIRQGPRRGTAIPVDVPTHVTAIATFVSGASVTLTFSFDGFSSRAPGLEIYGTQGAIALAHPNDFTAPLHLSTTYGEWYLMKDESGWHDNMWAIGVVEALDAFAHGREPRTSPLFAAHVIDVMAAIERLCHSHGHTKATIETRCMPPEPIGSYSQFPWRFVSSSDQE